MIAVVVVTASVVGSFCGMGALPRALCALAHFISVESVLIPLCSPLCPPSPTKWSSSLCPDYLSLLHSTVWHGIWFPTHSVCRLLPRLEWKLPGADTSFPLARFCCLWPHSWNTVDLLWAFVACQLNEWASILQMRKQRLKEVNWFVQDHMANERRPELRPLTALNNLASDLGRSLFSSLCFRVSQKW